MPAGTIVLTNNSTAVTGSGTAFTSELKANDFLVAVVGGATYTLGVSSVTSNTAMVLKTAYNGPSASGQAWTPIPNGTLVGITAQVAADVAKAIRGLNLDKANWQQVFSGTGNITVNLPDGSSYTGPAWNSLSTALAGKANTSDLGNSAGRNIGTTSGTVAAGDDSRLSTVGGKSGGRVTSTVSITNGGAITLDTGDSVASQARLSITSQGNLLLDGSGSPMIDAGFGFACRTGKGGAVSGHAFLFNWSGSVLQAWVNTSNIGNVTLTSNSDILLKKDISYPDNPEGQLSEVLQWRPAKFKYKARGVISESDEMLGFIANDLIEASPDCVNGEGLQEGYDEYNPEGAYSLDQVAMIAKLSGSIQALNQKMELRDTAIVELQKRLKALDGLDA